MLSYNPMHDLDDASPANAHRRRCTSRCPVQEDKPTRTMVALPSSISAYPRTTRLRLIHLSCRVCDEMPASIAPRFQRCSCLPLPSPSHVSNYCGLLPTCRQGTVCRLFCSEHVCTQSTQWLMLYLPLR
jgi:hypothetical protein